MRARHGHLSRLLVELFDEQKHGLAIDVRK